MHKIIKILIAASIFYNFSAGLLGPRSAIFVERIGGDILIASSAMAVYNIVMGVLLLGFGKIEDKVNKRKVIVVGYILSGIGFIGYLFVSNAWHLFLVQIILSLGAITSPAWDALFSASTDRKKECVEWGIWEGSVRIDIGIAAVVGGLIASAFGFRLLFLFMALTAFSSAFISTMLLSKKTWKSFLKLYKISKI